MTNTGNISCHNPISHLPLRIDVQIIWGDTSMRLCARGALRRRLLSANSRACCCCLQIWLPITRQFWTITRQTNTCITDMLCLLALRLLSAKSRAYCCCLHFWLPIARQFWIISRQTNTCITVLQIFLKPCSPGAHCCT